MDVLDTVREMRPTYPASTTAPRRALNQEIARARRGRPTRRVVGLSLGAAAVAAGILTITNLVPPGAVNQPQAASASSYLVATADSMRAASADPRLATTVTVQQLGMVGGPNAELAPFGDIREGATGAVVTESALRYATDAAGSAQVSTTDLHPTAAYGDEKSVEDAWNAYYAATDIGGWGMEPAEVAGSSLDEALAAEKALPVPVTGFPTEPSAFLAAWKEGMAALMAEEIAQRAAIVEDAGATSDPYRSIREEYEVPTAAHMMRTLSVSVRIHTAPAEYRATFLEALALAEGITVEDDSASRKILSWETPESRYRLTVDPEAGAIVSVEVFLLRVPGAPWSLATRDDPLIDVGSAPFLPADIPSRAIRVTSEALN